MKEANYKPCYRYETCTECLNKHYKEVYTNIEEITKEGTKVFLNANILGMDKRECTIKVINNAVIIDDGANEDYLCNCIDEDDEKCRSIELSQNE